MAILRVRSHCPTKSNSTRDHRAQSWSAERMASRQRDQQFAIGVQGRARTHEQRTSPTLDERCKGHLDLAGAADIDNDELLPDSKRRGLHVSLLRYGVRNVRVHQHGNCRRLRHELAQQLQPLRS